MILDNSNILKNILTFKRRYEYSSEESTCITPFFVRNT